MSVLLLHLQVYLPKGWAARGAVAYDGIGADYEAVSGKVRLNWRGYTSLAMDRIIIDAR